MMLRTAKVATSLALVALLGACASSATRMNSATQAGVDKPVVVQKSAKSVSIWLNEDAKKLVADNVKFNPETLRSTVERTLQAQNLIKADSTQTVDIEVTGFRVRSAFSAVMFGFMAGNDNIEGIVTIKGLDGAVLQQSKVKASYALGGLAGGQDEARMSWLYEEFAKHAVAEVTGAASN